MELADQVEMIMRTKEAQAVEALRTGHITVEGNKYPLVDINFGRTAANDIALAGTDLWSDAASDPMADLKTLHGLILKNGGGSARDVVMSVDAWSAFSDNDKVKALLDQRNRIDVTINEQVAGVEGVAYQGTINGFNLFTFEEWYEDANGYEQPALQSAEVLLLSPQVDGVQAHGAIRDEDAGLRSLEYFPKSWTEKDPSVRYLLMQSSFLMVPTRINACGRLRVL